MIASGVTVCLHGNEFFGLEVAKKLDVPAFIANPLAVKNNVRFIETDMNRSFPGKPDGSHEEREAYKLLKQVKEFRYLIDVHSSSCETGLFGIITKPNNEKIDLARKMHLKKAVIMTDKFARGSSLIDNLSCAISLEIGPHNRKENISEVVEAITSLKNNLDKDCSDFNMDIFEITDIIKGEDAMKIYLKNFKGVKKGELIAEGDRKYYAPFDFVPVLAGEKAYPGVICMAAKIIS